MKKIILPILVLFLVFTAGCAGQSDFELKKECAQYVSQYQDKVKEEVEWRRESYDDISVTLEGVFYSSSMNTCVAVVQRYNPTLNLVDLDPYVIEYTDALSGKNISMMEIPNSQGITFDKETFREAFEFVE